MVCSTTCKEVNVAGSLMFSKKCKTVIKYQCLLKTKQQATVVQGKVGAGKIFQDINI